jgi:hypothetical protein
MSDQVGKGKARWWQDILIAFVVAFAVSAYYSTKLTRAQQRAERAEAQLKEVQRTKAAPDSSSTSIESEAPADLICPEGTNLKKIRVIKLDDFLADKDDPATDWECTAKPRHKSP